MPSLPKNRENMSSHLTKDEIEAREKAEASYKRDIVKLTCPKNVKKDIEAKKVWKEIIKSSAELNIYDDLDVNALADYCIISSRLVNLRDKYDIAIRDDDTELQLRLSTEMRQQEALKLNYASKLGLTPESRLRLAVKKSNVKEYDENDDLYGS